MPPVRIKLIEGSTPSTWKREQTARLVKAFVSVAG